MARSTVSAIPFGLTEEQQELFTMCRDFADEELAPHALDWDAESHFPLDTIKRTAELGMGGIYIDEESGTAVLPPAQATSRH